MWRATNRADWHRWFAWFPVAIDGQWVWLQTVERREHQPLVWSDWTEYRLVPHSYYTASMK